MVVSTQGMEIDSFTKQSEDKDGATDTGFPQVKTPKHCNKGNSRIQGPGAPNFQPQAYPAYAQGQSTYRPPGLYNPVRGQNGGTYYGAPPSVMVSPGGGGYMRLPASYYHANSDYERGGSNGGFNPYHHPRFHHPMYGTDVHNRQPYENHGSPHPAQATMDFSRAVSSSFGESNTSSKSSSEKKESSNPQHNFQSYYTRHDDERSVASKADSDTSWKLLNQVASIEEEKFRNAEAGRLGATSPIDERSSGSTKSVEEKKYVNLPSPSKMAPLTSLASVSSVQEPLDTSNSRDELDLIQCASSGSLLFNTNESFSKRPREERGDAEDGMRGGGDDEIRGAPSSSPPNVGNISLRESEGSRPPKKRRGSVKSANEDYYDNPPSYSFSLESASSFSKDQNLGSLPPLTERSRASTYLAPLDNHRDREKNDTNRDDMLASSTLLWEIKGQDSFGGALSVGSSVHPGDGPVITSSFSFGKESAPSGDESKLPEYGRNNDVHIKNNRASVHKNNANDMATKTIDRTESHDINTQNPARPQMGKYPPPSATWVTNTSSFNRDSRSSGLYSANPPGPVRSYSSASTGPARQHPGQKIPREMMRNYSQDSERSSPATPGHMAHISRYGPLHGPYGTALPPHIPQSDVHLPPPFRPPHPHPAMASQMHMSRRPPPQAVYIMTSPPGGRPTIVRHTNSDTTSMNKTAGGVYSWSKQDDTRLSDIMKKFKNPKDWEPIAKAFGSGKTPKECHERWIRYLKPGVRKGQWQDHEDAIVVEAVTTSKEQPFTRWSDLAQRLPGRVGKQIRDRWVNHLNPNINHMPFTREDDLLLWDGHKKLGKRWVEISSKYFNSSRSENHIKNRWYSASFKKFIANEFGPDAYCGGKKKDGKGGSKGTSSKR